MTTCTHCENNPCVCADADGNLTLDQVIERARGRLAAYERAADAMRKHITLLESYRNRTDARAVDILCAVTKLR